MKEEDRRIMKYQLPSTLDIKPLLKEVYAGRNKKNRKSNNQRYYKLKKYASTKK